MSELDPDSYFKMCAREWIKDRDELLAKESLTPEEKDELKFYSAHVEIDEKVLKILELYRECAKIADEKGVYFNVPGPKYGLGTVYYPSDPNDTDPNDCGWESSNTGC